MIGSCQDKRVVMRAFIILVVVGILSFSFTANADVTSNLENNVVDHLQECSVTINAGNAEGSGVVVNKGGINFILTAAHVVTHVRSMKDFEDSNGKRRDVHFEDVHVIQDVIDLKDGRCVGDNRRFAYVIKYDAKLDLAVLRLRQKDFIKKSIKFHDGDMPKVGARLIHVGSMFGQFGSNSVTDGILSQIGRVYKGEIYDQTNATAWHGSSGCGVFLTDGRYMGMVQRGAMDSFVLIKPIREIKKWAAKHHLEWILDDKIAAPTDDEIAKIKVED